MEIATGDGFRIGCEGDAQTRTDRHIKQLSQAGHVRPEGGPSTLARVEAGCFNPEPDWVQYKGLWGVKSFLKDESGPPGPKWDRPDKLFADLSA